MTQPLADRIRNRTPTVGNWIALDCPQIVELTAEIGFDFQAIDIEHTTISFEAIESMARAADAAAGSTEVIVRVHSNDPVPIKRALDTGVSGVLVPMVETPEEARQAVRATQYPPDGDRGVGPLRASRYGLDYANYVDTANDRILAIVQIESRAGLENVEDIAAVDGLDALFVGPDDLSTDLGLFDQQDGPELRKHVDRVIEAAHGADLAVGTLVTTPDDIERWVNAGMDYLIAGWDVGYVIAGATETKETFDRAVENP